MTKAELLAASDAGVIGVEECEYRSTRLEIHNKSEGSYTILLGESWQPKKL